MRELREAGIGIPYPFNGQLSGEVLSKLHTFTTVLLVKTEAAHELAKETAAEPPEVTTNTQAEPPADAPTERDAYALSERSTESSHRSLIMDTSEVQQSQMITEPEDGEVASSTDDEQLMSLMTLVTKAREKSITDANTDETTQPAQPTPTKKSPAVRTKTAQDEPRTRVSIREKLLDILPELPAGLSFAFTDIFNHEQFRKWVA